MKIAGTALVEGVSKNGRKYSRETIAKAVARAQKRIREGGHPITMRSHHAGDDSLAIVGRLTSITLGADGSALYEAELAPTTAGKDIATLVAGARPFLSGVSIRGYWVGP
jgi:hypothetical protein